jgi:hypothetical protein
MRPTPLHAAAMAAIFCAALPAQALVVGMAGLNAQSRGAFEFNGTPDEDTSSDSGVISASTQVLLGSAATPELRTAGRVSGNEIAVNVRIDGKQSFQGAQVDTGESRVSFEALLGVLPGGGPERVYAAFHLPAGYLETMHNAELAFLGIDTSAEASIEVRRCPPCAPERLFSFELLLESTFRDEQHTVRASGQPGLDVAPLLEAQFADSGAGFLRTRSFGFEDFEGVLDLGVLSGGEELFFDYTLIARAVGTIAWSTGIAAINDPFLFDGDPVRQAPTLRFFSVPVDVAAVPEPATTALLLAAALGGTVGVRRRSA